jgi:Ca2+/H+ antiporter, TMEM165/GDT1 family
MNLRAVIFCFVVLLAATLNFGFFVGDIDNPDHHNVYELFAATVINSVATVLKLGDRTHLGVPLCLSSGRIRGRRVVAGGPGK